MIKNDILEKIRSGQKVLGSWVCLNSPLSAEILAYSGFDWVQVDIEHSAINTETTMGCFQAITAGGSVPMARIPWNDGVWIRRTLDSGAMGLIVPMVNSAAEAKAAVDAARFPPVGRRSFGGGRISTFGDDYIAESNHEIMLLLQIEHKDAFENLDAILDVPGYDGIFIGPTDLALSMGLPIPAQGGSAELDKQVGLIRDKALAKGMFVVTTAFSPEAGIQRLKEGFSGVTLCNDWMFIRNGAREGIARIKQAIG